MLFNSMDFLVFFPIVVCIYFILPEKIKGFWLLVSSYYFYMCWNVEYVVLLLSSTGITYISGLLLEQLKQSKWGGHKKKMLKGQLLRLAFS